MPVKIHANELAELECFPLAIVVRMPDDHCFRFVFATPRMQVPDGFNDQLLERMRVKLHAGGEIIDEDEDERFGGTRFAPHSMALGCTESYRV